MLWRFLLAALFAAFFSQTPLSSQSDSSGAITLRVIVVSSDAEAQQILDRLKRGEDFGALAKSKSIDPYAEDYGYLGKVNLATLRPDEAELMHSLHTAIIDRQERLAANIEGNQFTARQLGDLVQTILDQSR